LKIYGYAVGEREDQPPQPSELAEVTINASPDELREMSKFLADCASEMDRLGRTYDHVHLSDRIKAFRSSPHFVVARCQG
jgi:hypothetical protein